jgi:hypothetical protein
VVPPGTELGAPPDRTSARLALGVPGGDPVVAFVGRLTGVKRPDRLVEVARELRRLVPGVRFVICGSGDAAGTVTAAVPEFGGAMRMVGWRRDVETVYAAADLVLLTSDNEGMPVSLIEAGLSGVPVVATRVGSVAEVVHDGVTGLLAPCDAGARACSWTTPGAVRWAAGRGRGPPSGSGPNASSPTSPGSTRPSPRNGAGGPYDRRRGPDEGPCHRGRRFHRRQSVP